MPGIKKSTVSAPMGMIHSFWFPILAEPEASHPQYGAKIDMGHAVKGYLSITTISGQIDGDDEPQVKSERFDGGQMDIETTMNDLELNAKLYGHQYSEENGEISAADDEPAVGGWAGVEPILKKDKTTTYRATCLYKCTPIASSEKQEADTRKKGEFSPKMNAVSMSIDRDKLKAWRQRKEFESLKDADAWIETIFPNSAPAKV